MNLSRLLHSPLVRRLAAVAPFLALVLPHLFFTPIYDGEVYGQCLFDATRHGFDLWALNCASHPSMGYMSLLALAFKLGGGRSWPLILVNAALGVAAIVAFLALLDRLYPERPSWERLLAAACLGAVPPFAASALNIGIDYGALVFFVLLLLALVRERRLEVIVAGLFLAFSKEPGIFLFCLAVAAYLLAFTLRRPLDAQEKRRRVLAWLPTIVVPLGFVGYLGARALTRQNLMWSGRHVNLLKDFLTFQGLDPTFASFLATTFVINFAWVLSLVVLVGVVRWVIRAGLGKPHPEPRARAELVGALLVVSTWALTRHRTYVNVRYFLPLFPLLVWAAFHVAGSFDRRVRAGLFALVLALFVISAERTVDPVAKLLYGTFPFGSHPVLKITSMTGECCGYGRDQLVYNLEFTHLDTLLDDALADLRPSPQAPIALAQRAHWYELNAVMPGPPPYRSLPRAGAQAVPEVDAAMVHRIAPPTLYWLDFPNVDGDAELKDLEGSYRPIEVRTYHDGGYAMRAVVMTRR